MVNIEAATEELHRAFRCLNEAFFDGELSEPAITIQTGGKRSTMGWCSRSPIWLDSEGKIQLYEINIAAEYLNNDFYETMDTMLHEMVHLYNKIRGVQDVSRGGQYHNKRFRDECLRRGFYYPSNEPDKKLGWSFAKITDETKAKIDQFKINRDVFVIARNTFGTVVSVPAAEGGPSESGEVAGKGETQRKKSHIRKYVCPGCGNSVRASKVVNIRCDDCDEKMVEVP
ncbi:SprT-like domain-containing protein [Paenibacillus macerans]|uniref:SprT-like family protein n=1 Tax=Paenibacillus macerans TaxID=44252 RepID=A0A090Y2V6_PAEMA|nr:SprT-like domain-containing protein [Paenibacillus macerans]KFM93058.1 sprT-like family protein [Paenibacillus macerans]MCY7558543.1 SprT-like domain-containing protein [Paenibacillus macerans]MEC0153949.1 SprT-like domain-containing protein [Paenibacillus macerans]SUA84780.1 SprT-like family [Paenibacillus macerans]